MRGGRVDDFLDFITEIFLFFFLQKFVCGIRSAVVKGDQLMRLRRNFVEQYTPKTRGRGRAETVFGRTSKWDEEERRRRKAIEGGSDWSRRRSRDGSRRCGRRWGMGDWTRSRPTANDDEKWRFGGYRGSAIFIVFIVCVGSFAGSCYVGRRWIREETRERGRRAADC